MQCARIDEGRAVGKRRGERARAVHNERQAAVFNVVADDFLKPLPRDVVARTRRIVAMADLRPGMAVLDVGTGTGALLSYVLDAAPAAVVACDLAEAMLRRARARFGEQVRFLKADVVDLPLAVGPFDRVLCNAMFGNVYDQGRTLTAIGRLLKPRGRLVISHPMGRAFVRNLRETTPEVVRHDLPDEATLAAMARAAGLRLVVFVDEADLYVALVERPGAVSRPGGDQRPAFILHAPASRRPSARTAN